MVNDEVYWLMESVPTGRAPQQFSISPYKDLLKCLDYLISFIIYETVETASSTQKWQQFPALTIHVIDPNICGGKSTRPFFIYGADLRGAGGVKNGLDIEFWINVI